MVFYELLTGDLPKEPLLPPSGRCETGPQVDAIVRQALEPERDRRQQSAAEMRTQVEIAQATPEPAASVPPPPPPPEDEPAGDPKLCRLALVGAIWAGAGLVAGVLALLVLVA